MSEQSSSGLYFVYRDVERDPFGKHVRRLPDSSVRHWLARLRVPVDQEAGPPQGR